MEFFESIIPLVIVLPCCAGAIFLLIDAYMLLIAKNALDKTMKQVNGLLDEVSLSLAQARNTLDRVNLLMGRIVLSADTLNLSLVKVNEVLSDVGACTHGVVQAGKVFTIAKMVSAKKDRSSGAFF